MAHDKLPTAAAPVGPRTAVACVASLALASLGASATEGGGNSYPVGVETNYNGLMLAEGLHAFGYYARYEASHSKDNAGNDNRRLAYFNLKSDVLAARLSYVWPGVKLLGANVETRIVQALVSVNLSIGIARPAPAGPLDRSGTLTGLADTAFTPLILGWHSPSYHQTVGIDTHLPLGRYDVANRVNTGRHYYQVAPFYALTWFPSKAVDVNAKFRYAVNTRNSATDYRSGDEATVEFSAGYRASPTFAFGLNGLVYRQTTDDTQAGAVVNGNGNCGRVTALGPYLSYSLTNTVALIVKLQSEFDARNRPEGTRVWVQVKAPL